MIRVTLTSHPGYDRTLHSRDLRELCIRAENTIRLWLERGRTAAVEIEGGTPAERAHVKRYLDDVRAEATAVPLTARGSRSRR